MSTTPPSDNKATVVIIDDDPNILELTSLILSRKGYHVLTASTARQGMDIISSQAPELVFLDYMLPEMDALATLREIKTRYPDTYVIMFIGKDNEEIAVELIKGGASEYILKPFNNRGLLGRFDSVLRIREIELHNKALQQEQARFIEEIDRWNQELQKRVREKTEALQKALYEIAQSEKLATLDYLSADIAHELRNPLNTISLFVQLMRQKNVDLEQTDYLDKVLKEIDRIDSIISKLLGASHRSRCISPEVQIDRVVDNAIDAFSPQIETGNIRVVRRYHGVPPAIKADPAELEQIFTNLFLNALDEMPGGGSLDIEIYEEGGRVVVKVGDSGVGIPADTLPNIFEPFFTTKSRGAGMGLPVVRRIARLYQGSVAVEKSSPEGTVFRLEFPAVFQA
jgi:signal transduction histidine kinase